MTAFASTAEKYGLSERQVEMLWYRGQIGVGESGDRKGNKNAPTYFTELGLTATGREIYEHAEASRRNHIDACFRSLKTTSLA